MGTLYLVATPIGNLGDITLRAIEILKAVDVIACEDTRHTLTLLNRLGIKKPLISYYKQKENEATETILARLEGGENVALVTDAGMPCISDPGSVLVRGARERGVLCTVAPGANAAVSAVALSGVEGGFMFVGFLPEKQKDREILLASFASLPAALVFYAAPHDVNRYLDYLYAAYGDRTVHVVKELTKIYERVTTGTLACFREENPRGEYVVIVERGIKRAEATDEDIEEALREMLDGGEDKKSAVSAVAEKFGIGKNRVYKLALKL